MKITPNTELLPVYSFIIARKLIHSFTFLSYFLHVQFRSVQKVDEELSNVRVAAKVRWELTVVIHWCWNQWSTKSTNISVSNTMDKFVLFQYVRVGQRYSRHQSRTRKHWKGNGQFKCWVIKPLDELTLICVREILPRFSRTSVLWIFLNRKNSHCVKQFLWWIAK